MTVIELFTSQGCSACPPADNLLDDLASRPDVLPLSEHVDYWDYLGWRDPFGRVENTQRQRGYAHRLGLSYVYTPQFVVHGETQAVGRDRIAVFRLINEAKARPDLVSVGIERRDDGTLMARLEPAVLSSPADIWLVRFDPAHVTAVADGENEGRSIKNVNVVRGFTLVGRWSGEAASLPLPELSPTDSYALLVQESNAGPILGATRLQIPSR